MWSWITVIKMSVGKKMMYLSFIRFSRSWRELMVLLAFFISALIDSSSVCKFECMFIIAGIVLTWHCWHWAVVVELSEVSLTWSDIFLLGVTSELSLEADCESLSSCDENSFKFTLLTALRPLTPLDSSPSELISNDVRILPLLPTPTAIQMTHAVTLSTWCHR